MFVQASQGVRHFVGRLDRGEGVHEAFLALAQSQSILAGWVTAVGAFESATVGAYDQANRKDRLPRRFTTPMDVVSLVGNFSLEDGEPVVHLYATLSRETDNGVEVLGGRLFGATVFALEFTVVALDDANLERGDHPGTGMHLWRPMEATLPASRTGDRGASPGAAGAPTPSPTRVPEVVYKPSPRASSTETPRAVAARTPEPAVPPTPPMPPPPRAPEVQAPAAALPPRFDRPQEPEFTEEISAGDILQHPRFNEVEVVRVTESGRLEIRLPTGSLKEISVEIFAIRARPERDGHRVWLLTNKVPR